MGFGKVHSVVNGIWHTSLMEVLVWPGPSWPIVPIVLMSRAIPALFAQHALVDSWQFFNIVTTTITIVWNVSLVMRGNHIKNKCRLLICATRLASQIGPLPPMSCVHRPSNAIEHRVSGCRSPYYVKPIGMGHGS